MMLPVFVDISISPVTVTSTPKEILPLLAISTVMFRFAVVLPVTESMDFLKVADTYGLHLCKKMKIIPIEGKEPNRVNLELRFAQSATVQEETFVIRDIDNRFTKQYNEFLKEYYLGL